MGFTLSEMKSIAREIIKICLQTILYFMLKNNKLSFQFKDDETKLKAYQDIKDVFGGRLEVVNKNGRLYFDTIPTNY